MSAVRAISFDLDGTLYRVRRLRVAWRLRAQRGLLVALVAAREKIRNEAPLADARALRLREAELVAPSFGLSFDETLEQLDLLESRLPEALTRGRRPHSGVRSALQRALAGGARLAVLSDYAPVEKLKWLGLEDLPWHATLGAEETGALKPHRRSFDLLAERLEVRPEQILHIGDREDLDVEGALGAGFRAWRFAPKGAPKTRAERVFSSWESGLFAPLFD